MNKLTPGEYAVSAWSGGTTTQLAIFPPEAKYADRDFLWRVSSATVELEESDFTALPDYDRLIATLRGEIVLTHNGGAPLRLRPFEVHAFSGADATHSVGRCTDFNLMLRRGRAAGTMEALRLTQTPIYLSVGVTETSPACRGGGAPQRGAEEGCRPPEAPGIRVGSEFRVQSSEPVGANETLLLYCAEGFCTATACSAGPCFASLPAVPPAASDGAPVCAATEASPACHSERSEAESKNPYTLVSLRAGETLLLTAPAPLILNGTATLMLCRIWTDKT